MRLAVCNGKSGEMMAIDNRTFRINLTEPFGLMLKALAKSASVPVRDAQAGWRSSPISPAARRRHRSPGPFIFKKKTSPAKRSSTCATHVTSCARRATVEVRLAARSPRSKASNGYPSR